MVIINHGKEIKMQKINLTNSMIFVALSYMMIICACHRKDNMLPEIHFINPRQDITVTTDSIIKFELSAQDQDGKINTINIYDNDNAIISLNKIPYSFEYSINKNTTIGNHIITAEAIDNDGGKTITSIKVLVKSYLEKCFGKYEGKTLLWSTYPKNVNGNLILCNDSTITMVSVEVIAGTQDSSLNIQINRSGRNPENIQNLFLPIHYTYFSSSGGGSSYSSLQIIFRNDSMIFNRFQKCGIPCSQGEVFNIIKL